MSVTYDWSPFTNALSGLFQNLQYRKMLDSMGSQLPGGSPAVNVPATNLPPVPVGQTAAPPIVNSKAPLGAGVGLDTPMTLNPSTPALTADAAPSPLVSMLKGLPPEYGIPMLLNTMQKQQDRQYQREDKQMTPMSTAEVAAAGFKPGTVAYKDAFGGVHVEQASDRESPEAIQQAIDLHRQEAIMSPDELAQKEHLYRIQQAPEWAGLNEKKREFDISNPFAGNSGAGAGLPGGNVSGDAVLRKLQPQIASQVKALAEGRMAFPGGFALKSPYWQNMISLVSQYDPLFDAVNYNARAKTRGDFTSGKSAQNITAINTAIGHLGQLGSMGGDVADHNFTPLNAVENAGAQLFGSPAINNYKQTADAVAHEVRRVFAATGGGTEAELDRQLSYLSPNNSADQKAGAIKNIVGLLKSRLDAIGEQYKQGMGTDKMPIQLVSPHAQSVLDNYSDGPAKTSAGWSIKLKGQ